MKTSQICIFTAALLWGLFCISPVPTSAAIPHLINYQGRLTDKSGSPLNGSYALTFRIYDAENAGNLLWQGTYNNVSITKGIFTILLGDTSDPGYNFETLVFDKSYWLEVKIGEDVMSPRQRIASAAYAMRAEHGVPRGVITMWAGEISDVPSGWALCDGTNGTPDLRDKFIVGAGNAYSVTATGGETKHVLIVAEIPAHTHTVVACSSGNQWNGADSGGFNAPNTITSSSAGGGQPHENRPPYYALAYIMKL